MWLPPGGHIDPHELPHDAAVREVHEETGLAVALRTVPDPAR
jgi:8-oxo-dGTP pyrophosphatase MutT (NUDIX family)